MKEPIYDYDPAAALNDPETIALFISDAFQTGDASYIAEALGVVARAKGMTDLAEASGVTRENLYRSFSAKGNPTLKTLVAVMTALGVDMIARPHTTV
ncbi:addiction module antidote protein [Serratia proteamaculans]|uniref:addiction module antidote protein n=1 Tax=Serratia proteamaculans TaxID=28151 RepID=UPI003D0681CE